VWFSPVPEVATHSFGSQQKSAFEPQNVEREISNIEAPAGFTSAVRYSLFDILKFRYFV